MKLSVGTGTGQVVLNSGLMRSDQVTGNVGGNVAGTVGGVSGVTWPQNFSVMQIDTTGLVGVDVQAVAGSTASASTNIDANIVSVNGSTFIGDSIPATLAEGSITGGSFAASAIDSTVFDQSAADKMWSTATRQLTSAGVDQISVETGLNLRQAISIIAAALAGQVTGAATTTVNIAAANNSSTTRISSTVDSSGDRSSITLSPPA